MEKTLFDSTKFITGLRGYAALAVFLIHIGGFGLRELSIYTNRIVDSGKYGVMVFFVLSAFTISMSISREENFHFFRYIFKRFLRIAPMYYLVLLIGFFLGGSEYYNNLFGTVNSLSNLLFHISFLNWINYKHQNNIIGVEWSVPIEFTYYLIIPFLYYYLIKNKQNIAIVLIVCGIISSIGLLLYKGFEFAAIAYHWSLLKYLFSFTFGIVIYIIFKSKHVNVYNKTPNLLLVLILISLLVLIILDFQYPDFYITIFCGFLILSLQQPSILRKILFENSIIQFIGKISYSFYLLHILIMNVIGSKVGGGYNPLLILLITFIISSLTYYLVEQPFIKFSKKQF